MPAIIYEKTSNGLYPTGERTVSTFPSGLVRVDQTFVCKTSAAGTHRTALAVGANFPNGSSPAIDGLKIFPEPQEKQRDDGFTEFIVSAYGRTSTGSNATESFNSYYNWFSREMVTRKTINLRYTIKSGEPVVRYPQIASQIVIDDVNWNKPIPLQTNGDLLINQSVIIPSSFTPTFFFSFQGTGTVSIVGNAVYETINISGTGANAITSQTINKNTGSGISITVTGDVRNAILKKSEAQPPSRIIPSFWYFASIQNTNFGIYNEVSVNYNSY